MKPDGRTPKGAPLARDSADARELIAREHDQRTRGAQPGPQMDPRSLAYLADDRRVRARAGPTAPPRAPRPPPRARPPRPRPPRSRRRADRDRASRTRPSPPAGSGTRLPRPGSRRRWPRRARSTRLRRRRGSRRGTSHVARGQHRADQRGKRRRVAHELGLERDPSAPAHHRDAVRADRSGDEHRGRPAARAPDPTSTPAGTIPMPLVVT